MKTSYFKKPLVLALLCVGMIGTGVAQAQQNNKFGILSFNKAVNVSGKQRMLTQKMAKAYLYLIQNPSDAKAKRDLLTSKIIFEKQNNIIHVNSGNPSTKKRLATVDQYWATYKGHLESTPNYDTAKQIIELNTDILKATDAVVSAVIVESKSANQGANALDDESNSEELLELKKTINIAGRQRMLAQRLALYYFANNATLKDENLERMLNNVYHEFDGAITMLLISDFNTSQIDEKLGIAMAKWETIKNNKEKLNTQGFKYDEIYKLSNELTKAFNDVTILYEKVK